MHFGKLPILAASQLDQRAISTTTRINGSIHIPGVGQVFAFGRRVIVKNTDKISTESAVGLTGRTSERPTPSKC